MAGRRYLNALRQDLLSGEIVRKGRLPTLREMAGRYSCSMSSIRQAVAVLAGEGLLHARAGSGIYVGATPVPRPESRRRLLGAVTLHHFNFSIVERLKMEWQKRGWLIANYDAWSDFQDPAREREFLEQACREEFAGVAMCATPIEPVNTAAFDKMRRKGLKIAHLSPYRLDMENESFFFPDYRAAGRLGVTTALLHQCRQVVTLEPNIRAPYLEQMRQGVVETATGMQIPCLEPLRFTNWDADWHDNHSDREKESEFRLLTARLHKLPDRTAILCSGSDIAHALRSFLRREETLRRRDFFILSLNNGSADAESENGVCFDFEQITRAALDYLCDDTVNSLQIVQHYFPPVVRQRPPASPQPCRNNPRETVMKQ